jgi:hypothetical protein
MGVRAQQMPQPARQAPRWLMVMIMLMVMPVAGMVSAGRRTQVAHDSSMPGKPRCSTSTTAARRHLQLGRGAPPVY